MSESAPVVYVVDDDESFLPAVCRLLRASGFAVKAFSSPSEFLAAVSGHSSGCAILDVRMPGMTGLDLQAELTRRQVALPVIFLTGEGDIPTSVRAMRSGAENFIEKRAPKDEILDAVRAAFHRDAADRARRNETKVLRDRFALLSDREREVLEHVVQGKLNKEIAADLGIHERTVKLHRTAITGKLGVPSVAELTRLCLELSVFPKK